MAEFSENEVLEILKNGYVMILKMRSNLKVFVFSIETFYSRFKLRNVLF